MKTIKDQLSKYLEITDGGQLHWTVGIEVGRDRPNRSLWLSQKAYIEAILQRYNCFNTHRSKSSIPFDPNVTLTTKDGPKTPEDIAYMRNKPYREALGALMYCAVATRPDISFSVSQLSKFSSNPGRKHWNALCKVYAYLKIGRAHV